MKQAPIPACLRPLEHRDLVLGDEELIREAEAAVVRRLQAEGWHAFDNQPLKQLIDTVHALGYSIDLMSNEKL